MLPASRWRYGAMLGDWASIRTGHYPSKTLQDQLIITCFPSAWCTLMDGCLSCLPSSSESVCTSYDFQFFQAWSTQAVSFLYHFRTDGDGKLSFDELIIFSIVLAMPMEDMWVCVLSPPCCSPRTSDYQPGQIILNCTSMSTI